MIQRRSILVFVLLAAIGSGAAATTVTNRVSFDLNYLSGVSGRTHMVPIRLNPGGAPVGGISFDLCLSPATGVLKFVGVSAPWAEFNGGLVATVGSAAPGSANIRVLALNSVCPGALSGDHEALDLCFEVVGPPGSVCNLELLNVVSVTTPAAGTTNEAALVCVTEATPATFTVSGRMAGLQLLANGGAQSGGINTLELWMSGDAPVSAFDVTLNFPTWLGSIVDVAPATRGMAVTAARDTFKSGAARIVGMAASPVPSPGGPHPVATVFYEGAKLDANVSFTLDMDVNGLCVDDMARPGFIEHEGATTDLEARASPGASEILTAESMMPGDQAPLDLLAFAPLSGSLDMTLIFPANVFRFVDATAGMPGMDLFYNRAQAASGTVRIIGVTANLDERCRDRLSLATVHLDVREGAPAGGTAKVRLEVNDLHALGPLPFASYLIEPVETEVRISAPEPPELALVTSNLTTLTWGETVEIPVTARVRGLKPVVALGQALRDPAQLSFNAIVPSGVGANGSVTVNTNAPGTDAFVFVSLDGAADPVEGPVELFKIRYDVIGKVHSAGEAGVSLQAAAHGVEYFPNKTASAALACLRFNIGESDVDTDGDLMPDWWEFEHFGGRTSGVAANDSDHDGCPDGEEFEADTDPLNPSSRLAITALRKNDSALRLWWQGGAYATQYIETCDVLAGADTVWQTVFTNKPPTEVEGVADVPMSTTSRFYRVRAER